MTRTNADWNRYVRHVAGLMRLSHWEINVLDGPSDAGTAAQVFCTEGRHHAAIRLSENFPNLDEHEQRYLVCHELVHVHLAAPDSIVEANLPSPLGSAWAVTYEYAVDALANVVAGAIPLPGAFFRSKK